MRFLLFGSLMLTACFELGSATNGDAGHVKFEYGSCLFGCKVDEAMMNGTTEKIRVTASSIPPVIPRSTDSSIIAVGDATRQCCPSNGNGPCRTLGSNNACNDSEIPSLDIPVVTKGVGTAELVLDQGGTPFDSVTLKVAAAGSLVLSCGEPGTFDMKTGDECGLSWTASDSNGDALMATTGVTVTTSDPTIAALSTGFVASNASTIEASQQLFAGSSVTARAPGVATISASAGNATSKVLLSVTP
jgi:hypothetical protein